MMSAVITGLLAASAGVFTKAAGDADHLATYACSHHHLLPVDILCRHFSESVMTVIIQVMLYGLMIGSNVAMFNCFNATLQRCDTTIVASVTCTAANITFSVRKYSIHSFMISILDSFPPSPQAFFGHVVFGEVLTFKWFAGAVLVVMGAFLLMNEDRQPDTTRKRSE